MLVGMFQMSKVQHKINKHKCLSAINQTYTLLLISYNLFISIGTSPEISVPSSKLFLKLVELQSFSEIIETIAKNGVVLVATSNVKLFLKTILW